MRKSGLRGFSLIEILVVVALFAMISIIVSQTTVLSLRGTKKSDSTSTVRENLNYAMGVTERQLRSAQSITSSCTGTTLTNIDFVDENGVARNIGCSADSIFFNGSSLTSSQVVKVSSCEYVCTQSGSLTPPDVSITYTGTSVGTSGVENSTISVSTQVTLRSY